MESLWKQGLLAGARSLEQGCSPGTAAHLPGGTDSTAAAAPVGFPLGLLLQVRVGSGIRVRSEEQTHWGICSSKDGPRNDV